MVGLENFDEFEVDGPDVDLESVKRDYKKINQQTYNQICEHWDSKRGFVWEPIKVFLNENLDVNRSLLDLGSGNGRLLDYALKIGYSKENLVGVDFSQSLLSFVAKKGFKTVFSDLEDLKLEDESFDLVINIAVLHHLLSYDKFENSLLEIRRVLKVGGRVLLSVWFPQQDYVRKNLQKGKFRFVDVDEKIVRVFYTVGRRRFRRYYYRFEEDELREICSKFFVVENLLVHKGNLYLELRK